MIPPTPSIGWLVERRSSSAVTAHPTRGLRVAATLVLASLAWLSAADVSAQHVPAVPRQIPPPRGSAGVPDLDPLRASLHRSGWTDRLQDGFPTRRATGGTLRVLVIPALFADSPEPTFTQEDIQANLFDGPAVNGTLGEFYGEMSRGGLSVTGSVAPWFRSSLTLAEVRGGDVNGGANPRTGEYLLEAIAAADGSLDLRQFDNDGPDDIPSSGDDNGYVDALFFLYHEVGLHCGGTGPWPHFGGLSPWNDGTPYASDDLQPSGQPIQADGYVLSTLTDCAGVDIGAMPVAAHELGHVLGVPDFYHPVDGRLPTERRWILGCWALMAAGAWGCGASDEVSGNFGPAGMAPWSKDRLGWLNVEDVGTNAVYQEYVLEPVQASGHVLDVPLDDSDTESFMVEYRPQAGFDQVLPSSGVLIYRWHKDGWLRPHPDSSAQFYMFSLVEADANGTLQRTHAEGGNRGEPGDAWAANGQSASFTNLDDHKPLLTSGLASTVTFHDIRVEGGVARIRLSSASSPVAVGAGNLPSGTARQPYEVRLPIGGGALPYVIEQQPALPVGMSIVMVEGRELLVSGAPVSTGAYESEVGIRDARGDRNTTLLRLVVAGLGLAVDRLLSPFLDNGAAAPTAEDLEILDNDGNGNGTYDVGDLRAQLVGR